MLMIHGGRAAAAAAAVTTATARRTVQKKKWRTTWLVGILPDSGGAAAAATTTTTTSSSRTFSDGSILPSFSTPAEEEWALSTPPFATTAAGPASPQPQLPHRVAVLIDADNASPRHAIALFEEVAKWGGRADVRRIYGNFVNNNINLSNSSKNPWIPLLPTLSMVPVQQFNYTAVRGPSGPILLFQLFFVFALTTTAIIRFDVPP
jgi:hypothetical protein